MHRYCVYNKDKKNGECEPIKDDPGVPVRVYAIGTGFLLLKRSVIVKAWEGRGKYGWPFDPLPHGVIASKSTVQSSFMGEDLSFCSRLRQMGFDIWCHPDVKPGHVGEIMLGAKDKEQ